MTTGHVFIAVSLDGYIARENHDIGWLTELDTGDEDHGYEAFDASIDGLVMGSGSYRKVLTFEEWPYRKPVVVMSHSLEPGDIPENLRTMVSVTTSSPMELMRSLDQKGWSRVYVDGGHVIQSFLRSGLIEDLVITTIPVLIGSGLRLFGELEKDLRLDLVESKAFASGLVQTRYRVRKPA